MTLYNDGRPAHQDDRTIMMMDHAASMSSMGVFIPMEFGDTDASAASGMVGMGCGAAGAALCHTTICPQIFTFVIASALPSLMSQSIVYSIGALLTLGFGGIALALKPEKGDSASWRRNASIGFAAAASGFALSTTIETAKMLFNMFCITPTP